MPIVSVFANEACTIRPQGAVNTVYVKFNKPIGFNEEHLWGSWDNPDEMMFIFTPTTEAPNETYQVRCYLNFLSEDFDTPFSCGDIVKCFNPIGAIDLSDVKLSFY